MISCFVLSKAWGMKHFMNKEVYYHWEYYQSLERRLELTGQYVDHACDDEGKIINREAYSYEFQQILLLLSVEFESVVKLLCKQTIPEYSTKHRNIVDLSEKLLEYYPGLVNVEISSDFIHFCPLKNFKIVNDDSNNVKCVYGLDWWKAYNSIKHEGFKGFREATLENVIYGMGALYIIELYYIQKSLHKTVKKKTRYFYSDHELFSMVGSGPLLPGVG